MSKDIVYRHLYNHDSHGYTGSYTYAFRRIETGDVTVLYVGLSLCSKKDNFCYATGREIASGRIGGLGSIIMNKELSLLENTFIMFRDIRRGAGLSNPHERAYWDLCNHILSKVEQE